MDFGKQTLLVSYMISVCTPLGSLSFLNYNILEGTANDSLFKRQLQRIQ